MALAPVPTPEVLWREPGVLALAALPGAALGHLGAPSASSTETWVAVGAAIRELHDAPLPPWNGRTVAELASRLADECEWLVGNEVLPADVITRNRRLAEQVLRPWQSVFIHGDALFDLATLTLGYPEHLADLVAGYGGEVDLELIRGWWSLRCLSNVRWLTEHGFGSPEQLPEVAVLRSQR